MFLNDFVFTPVFLCLAFSIAFLMLLISFKRSQVLSLLVSFLGILLSLFLQDDFWVRFILSASIIVLFMFYERYKNIEKAEEIYLLYLLSIMGASLVVISDNLLMFFVCFQLLSISGYSLMAFDYKDILSLEATIKYMVLSSLSMGLFLFGTAFLYIDQASNFGLVGFSLVLISLLFGLGFVPMHFWIKDVYYALNPSVLAFMGVIKKGAVLVFLFNFLAQIKFLEIKTLIIVLGSLSMIVGNLLMLFELNLKRLLAFSSISQIAYVMVISVLDIENKLEVFSVFFICYSLANILFCFLLERYQENKIYSLAFILSLFSFMGAPFTAGLIGKWSVLDVLIKSESWALLLCLVLGSIIGIFAYLRPAINISQSIKKGQLSANFTSAFAILLSFFILFLGVWPRVILF